jgi:bifunctional non-homologous end joining protein LigD
VRDCPHFIVPCQPTLRSAPPCGLNWVHEVKFDGWRLQLHKVGRRVRLLSRHGHDLTARFPTIAFGLAAFGAESAILDGELVAMTAEGLPDFRALHRRAHDAVLGVWLFDLLSLDGRDQRPLPLDERRQRLKDQMGPLSSGGVLHFSHDFTDPVRLLDIVDDLGLEGVVSKRRDTPYRSGRRPEWVKVKAARWREANRERWRLFEGAGNA